MPDNLIVTGKQVNNQTGIITHAVLVGLTPLIPIPLIDDLVKGYFLRRMINSLAAANHRQLSAEDIAMLTEERGSGCLRGCLGQAFLLPLKLIFRKVFFFLEWKRALDLTSHTYHQGYLLDYALREGWLGGALNPNAPGATDANMRSMTNTNTRSAAEIRTAIDEVCREAPIKPVETAIKGVFKQSKGMLLAGARVLTQAFKRVTGQPDEKRLAEVVAAVEPEEERQIGGVVGRMQQSIEAIPDEHFRTLRARLAARLKI